MIMFGRGIWPVEDLGITNRGQVLFLAWIRIGDVVTYVAKLLTGEAL